MRNLITVAEFTIKDMVKRKSFIVSMIIILVLIVVGFNIPNIINSIKGENSWNSKILLIDSQNLFEGNLEALNSGESESSYDFIIENKDISKDEIKSKIETGEIDCCLKFIKNSTEIVVDYYVESVVSFGQVPQEVLSSFSSIYKDVQISKLGLSAEQLIELNMPFNVNTIETDENAAKGNQFVVMLISLGLFIAIHFFAYQVSSSITTEKTSKIMETLITSTKPKSIIVGKTIGTGLVGLFQILIIGTTAVISAKIFLPEGALDGILDMSNITPMLAIVTIVYFILGFFLFAFLYALTGSTVSKPEDISSANSPIAFIETVGFYLAYFSMMNPSSNINMIASILPISSPFGMPFRVMMGTATNTQLLTSLLILVVTIILIAKISIKIYSSAILNYGTKLSFKDMMRLYRNK
jgi:ABC-2 type transport system permease protein